MTTINRPPFPGNPAQYQSWQRLPLAAVGVTISAVIQAAPLFALDARQRAGAGARHERRATAWIAHFASHLDAAVLPYLPEPFGQQYRDASEVDNGDPYSYLRVTPEMLYDLARALRIADAQVAEPVACQSVAIPMPLLPPVISCPRTGCDGYLTRHRSGDTVSVWLAASGGATRVPVFAAQCSACHTPIYPDRYQPSEGVGAQRRTEVLFRHAPALRIGRGLYATRDLGASLSKAVIYAHMPLSTFGQWWYSFVQPQWRGEIMPALLHDQLWRLFLAHHALIYIEADDELSLPLDEDQDDALINACLGLFPSTLTDPANVDPTLSDYRTYHIPGTSAHRCSECSHAHSEFRDGDRRAEYTDEQLLTAHRHTTSTANRIVTAVVIDGIEKIGHRICAVDDCGRSLTDYREGRFCAQHSEYALKCGVRGCLQDATGAYPACDAHRPLYRQWENRFGRDRTLQENRRWIRRLAAIEAGEERREWEPAVAPWDATIRHYWRARHIKVIEIAVTPCGVPLTWTKFAFAESETNIIRFMDASWPQPRLRPTYLAIDKGCKILASLHAAGRLFVPVTGWALTTNIKVATFHYTSHVADATCVEMCNPNDRRDPNLVRLSPPAAVAPHANARGRGLRAQARREQDGQEGYKRWFNFEAAEQLNSWLGPFSAAMTKMTPKNHAVFLCIILRERSVFLMNTPRDADQ